MLHGIAALRAEQALLLDRGIAGLALLCADQETLASEATIGSLKRSAPSYS